MTTPIQDPYLKAAKEYAVANKAYIEASSDEDADALHGTRYDAARDAMFDTHPTTPAGAAEKMLFLAKIAQHSEIQPVWLQALANDLRTLGCDNSEGDNLHSAVCGLESPLIDVETAASAILHVVRQLVLDSRIDDENADNVRVADILADAMESRVRILREKWNGVHRVSCDRKGQVSSPTPTAIGALSDKLQQAHDGRTLHQEGGSAG